MAFAGSEEPVEVRGTCYYECSQSSKEHYLLHWQKSGSLSGYSVDSLKKHCQTPFREVMSATHLKQQDSDG